MQTALTQLIEHLRISGNIHGAMEAEKFLPVEKNQLKDAYVNGTGVYSIITLELANRFFNKKYNNK